MNQSTTKNIPYLDGWRGLAVLLVLVSHFTYSPRRTWVGELGVALFFVLSGYFMGGLLFIKKVRLDDFFVKRFTRVFPTFILFVVSMALYSSALKSPFFVPSTEEFLATITFLRTYFPSNSSIWADTWPIGHLWSLNVEEHSYVFLALLAIVVHRTKWYYASTVALFIGVCTITLLNLYFFSHPPVSTSPWYLRSECASLGLVASAFVRVARSKPSWFNSERFIPRPLPIFLFTIALACLITYTHKGVQYTVAPICLALCVNFLDRAPALVRIIFSARWLRWMGQCSFSLYLWQQPFFIAVKRGELAGQAGFALAMICGTFSYYCFERPTRVWLNERWTARTSRIKGMPA